MAGVKKEVWLNVVADKFTHTSKFLAEVQDYSEHVENDVIHMSEIGADPAVLINHTGNVPVSAMADADIPVPLVRFDTENTKVTAAELNAISYDKISKVTDKHVRAIESKALEYAAIALAPTNHTAETPFLETTGSVVGGVKAITRSDIIRLKSAFDDLGIPDDGRVLVLTKTHYNQLVETDDLFKSQTLKPNASDGMIEYYGFNLYSYGKNPYYERIAANNYSKLPYGGVPGANHRRASFAYHKSMAMKAGGTMQLFMSEADKSPETRENVLGMRKNFVARSIIQYALCVIFPGV